MTNCKTCDGSGWLMARDEWDGEGDPPAEYFVPCPAHIPGGDAVAVPLDMIWPGGWAGAVVRGLESDVRPDPGLLMGSDIAYPRASGMPTVGVKTPQKEFGHLGQRNSTGGFSQTWETGERNLLGPGE